MKGKSKSAFARTQRGKAPAASLPNKLVEVHPGVSG